MTYQLITRHNAAAYTKGRDGHTIQYIIIHHWDDPAKRPTFEGVLSWFMNPRAGTSAHYVLEAGRVACLVAESDTAYHAGDWEMNCQSIGIECNPRCSREDLATLRELVSELLRRYPGVRIIGHKDVINTGCPGAYYQHLNALNHHSVQTPTPPASSIFDTHTIKRLQTMLGTPADGIISSQYAPNREYVPAAGSGWEWVNDAEGSQMVAALQKRLGVESDGIWGQQTSRALQARLGVTIDGYFGKDSTRALNDRLSTGKGI